MQIWSGQKVVASTRKFLTTVLIAASLAGMIIGFAVGGLTHPQSATTNLTNPPKKPTIIARATAAATPTATATPEIVLGPPTFSSPPTVAESTTNNTPYTVGIQAVDRGDKAVHASDITCKIWLIQQIPANQVLDLDPNALKNVNSLSNPIQGMLNGQPVTEITGSLNFVSTTSQTTTCNAQGQATWQYTISPTTPAGTYDLVVLTDWKGRHYNWSWYNITITHS